MSTLETMIAAAVQRQTEAFTAEEQARVVRWHEKASKMRSALEQSLRTEFGEPLIAALDGALVNHNTPAQAEPWVTFDFTARGWQWRIATSHMTSALRLWRRPDPDSDTWQREGEFSGGDNDNNLLLILANITPPIGVTA